MSENLKTLWDRESHKYTVKTITDENSGLRPSFLPSQDEVVLDAGCGAGIYLKYFSSKTSHLFGIDISPKMIEAASKEGVCQVADITALPYKDQTFDYILSFLVVSHCGNSQKATEELCRVLKEQGRLVLVLPNHFSFIALQRKVMMLLGLYTLGHSEHYTLSSLKKLFKSDEYEVEEHYRLTRFPQCHTLLRQCAGVVAFALDACLNRLLPLFWGECLVVKIYKKGLKS